ncbi:MAG: hypothetical protein Q8K67_12130 [Geothrix sp.]|nr:hypothetical protein [Geothrix sp.]
MACELQGERRRASESREAETRGALWSLPDGQRLPNLVEAAPLVLGDPAHPARLRPADLENPEGFHSRLTAWLLGQG